MTKLRSWFRSFAIGASVTVVVLPLTVSAQDSTATPTVPAQDTVTSTTTTTTKKTTAKKTTKKRKPPGNEAVEQAMRELESAFEAPESPVTKAFNDMNFLLKEDMHYKVGNSGVTITVPKGFVTDFASVPPEFWSVLPTIGPYARGAVVHDWLYWEQVCTREQSDNLLLIAMKESNVPMLKREAIYKGVRTYKGQEAWDDNAKERESGLVKILMPPYDDVHGNDEWADYRAKLAAAHVVDGPAPTNIAFCRLGNSTDVP